MVAPNLVCRHCNRSDRSAAVSLLAVSQKEALLDAVLVRRFNAGRRRVWRNCHASSPEMFSIALSHLGNHADAEEIAQDTFIRAYRGLASFRGDSSLATWLYRNRL